MKLMTDLLSSHWAHALGWTLLHSLWQALAVLLLVGIALRIIPAMRASLRYVVLSTGLLLLTGVSVFTFVHLMSQTDTPVQTGSLIAVATVVPGQPSEPDALPGLLVRTTSVVEHYIPVIIALWLAGFVIFSLRFAAGIVYTQRLRATATPLENRWSEYIKITARELGIDRLIALAESAAVSTPMVIGYFRPVILIPVGMLTGLTTQQLETVFLHELAHIRRHDYLINVLQSAVEVILFFNPFVWILSGLMRREREYCCDDLVVRQHAGSKAYAHALAQLAESSLSAPAFALSLANNNHQLLSRIKRIMEKSVKPYSGKSGKLIPALLLVSALFCISWLGIQRNTSTAALQVPAQDTIRPGKENVARYSRKRIITTDEHGQPHEEIVEEFQGDEDLRPLLENGLMPNQPVSSDSIPPVPFNMDAEQWEAFSEAFHENFNINFPDVVFGGEDLMAWVKEFEERFNANAEWPDSSLQFNLQPGAFGGQYNFDSLALKDFDKQFQRLHELQIEHFKNLNPNFGLPGNAWLQHEKTLRQHLVEDGYLSKDERIESMQWSDNSFKVNGKSIRKADREKYRSLYDQFMNGTIAQSVD